MFGLSHFDTFIVIMTIVICVYLLGDRVLDIIQGRTYDDDEDNE